MAQDLLQQLLLLLSARNGGQQKPGWACTLLMERHSLHVSNITALLSKSNNKDTSGLQNYVTTPLRSEVPKSHSLSSNICTLDLLFGNRAQGCRDRGECCRDICTRCLGHRAPNIREKQPFVPFQLSSLERLPAALFWPPYSPASLDCYPEKPTAQENWFWSVMSDLRGRMSKGVPQRWKHGLLSSLSADPKGHSISCLQQPHTYLY